MSDLALLLLAVLGVVLLFRGPKVLPRIGAALGRGVREVRQAAGQSFGRDDEDENIQQPDPRP